MLKKNMLMHGKFIRQDAKFYLLLNSTSIMKEGYLKTKPECRPRVFGMTASPLDAKRDPVKAAQ